MGLSVDCQQQLRELRAADAGIQLVTQQLGSLRSLVTAGSSRRITCPLGEIINSPVASSAFKPSQPLPIWASTRSMKGSAVAGK
jgi:hypothetical protein